MDSSVSPKDEIWFLRVYRHISTGLYFTAHLRTLVAVRLFVRLLLLWLLLGIRSLVKFCVAVTLNAGKANQNDLSIERHQTGKQKS